MVNKEERGIGRQIGNNDSFLQCSYIPYSSLVFHYIPQFGVFLESYMIQYIDMYYCPYEAGQVSCYWFLSSYYNNSLYHVSFNRYLTYKTSFYQFPCMCLKVQSSCDYPLRGKTVGQIDSSRKKELGIPQSSSSRYFPGGIK